MRARQDLRETTPRPTGTPPRRRRALGLATAFLSVLSIAAVPTLASPAAAAPPPACGTSGTPTVTSLQDPHFYIDSSNTPKFDSHYAGYQVTTGATGYQNLYVGLSNFQGSDGSASLISLSPTQSANQAVGQIAASTTTYSYFLLKASGPTTSTSPAQQHTISLWSGDPTLGTSTVLCTRTFSYTSIDETIKANPNTITSTTTSSSSGAVGGTIDVTINGTTGTIGSGPAADPEVFDMSGAAVSSFPAGTWQLVQTQLVMSPDGVAAAQTFTNLLVKNNVGSSARTYAATYRFRAVGTSATSSPVYPMQYIASGTQVKHTTPPTGTTLPSVPPSSNTLTLTATVNPTMLPSIGGTATYSVPVANSSSSPVTLDNLSVTLPAGVSYTAGSATFGGASITNPVISGSNLLFPGPWTIPALGSATFTIGAGFPATAGTYTASIVGHVGGVQIDTTTLTTDNSPAQPSLVVNIPPSAVNDSGSVYTGSAVTVNVLGNDTVAAPYTKSVASVGTPGHGTATANADGTITYTPTGGYTGTDSFTYALSDGYSTSSATVTITVYATAHAVNDSGSLYTGSSTDVNVLGNDTVDPAYTKSVSAVGTPSHGTATINPDGTIHYTPTTGYTGTDTFTYTLSDGHGSTSTATVTMTVYATANAVNDSTTTYTGNAVVVPVLANDSVDPAFAKSVSAVGTPSHGTATANPDGTITYTPNAGYSGSDTFTYTLSDGHGSTSTATVSVTVYAPANAVNDSGSLYSGSSTDVNVLGNDSVDPAYTKSVSAVGTPSHGTATINPDGTIHYVPNAGYTGTDTFTYTLSDGHGSTSTATVTMTVYATANAVNDSATTDYQTPVTVAVLTNDSVDPAFTKSVSAVGTPSHGTATANPDGTITYTPNAGYSGSDSFTYTLTDNHGSTSTATVSITVRPPAPTATDDSATTPYGVTLNVPAPGVLGNDTGTGLTAALTTPPPTAAGTATVNADGSYSFVPTVGFTGKTSFVYTATDSFGRTATATVTITVSFPAKPTCAGWTTNGLASYTGPCKIQLNPTLSQYGAGTSFWPNALPLAKVATISFDMTMGGGLGDGADGIGLVFADPANGATPSSLGGTGGQMGIGGIASTVVKFDTFQNPGDLSNNFVGLCTSPAGVPNDPASKVTCRTSVQAPTALRGASLVTHHVVVTLANYFTQPAVSTVTIDGTPVVTGPNLNIPKSGLIGFSAGTGLWTDLHVVSNIALTYRP